MMKYFWQELTWYLIYLAPTEVGIGWIRWVRTLHLSLQGWRQEPHIGLEK